MYDDQTNSKTLNETSVDKDELIVIRQEDQANSKTLNETSIGNSEDEYKVQNAQAKVTPAMIPHVHNETRLLFPNKAKHLQTRHFILKLLQVDMQMKRM